MKRILFYLVFILMLSNPFNVFAQHFTPPSGSPLAQKQHPRLFFTKNSFADLAQYIIKYEPADFQTYIGETEKAFAENTPNKNRNYLLLDAKNLAFLSYARASGIFTNYEFPHTAAEYAQKAFEHAQEIHRRMFSADRLNETTHCSSFDSKSEGGYVNLALAMVYDWCYDFLDLSQKQLIADALIKQFKDRKDEVNPRQKIKLGLTLLVHCHQAGVGGVTFWGDPLGAKYEKIAREMLDMTKAVWIDRVFAMGEKVFEGKGGWSEGANYFSGSSMHVNVMAAALSSTFGENLFEKYHWIKDLPRYVYYYLLPMEIRDGKDSAYYAQRNATVDIRDWNSNGALRQVVPAIANLKNIEPERAGFYRWFIEDSRFRISPAQFTESMVPRLHWLFFKFLWGYKDVPKIDGKQFNLPASDRFGLGDVILLSDLYSDNATKINFHTPTYSLPRHSHEDNAAIAIFKYGTLALDAGIPKGNSSLPKSRKTRTAIFHNKLAFYPPGDSPLYSYSAKSLDEADAPTDPENQPGGRNQMGELLALHFEPGIFDFADYDYTRNYKGENYVKRIRRALIYFRDPNAPNYSDQEYLLVFDDAEVTEAVIKRRWLLHTPQHPNLLDGHWQPQGDGFWTSESGSTLEISNTLLNAHGKLFVKVLAPQTYQLRLRGGNVGKKYFWFTDAEGKDLTKRGPFTDLGAFWAGTHRLEIEDETPGASSIYLTAMQIGDANTLKQMVEVKRIDADNFIGAMLNGERLGLFNKTENAKNSVSYSAGSDKTIQHVVTGLNSGKYQIFQNSRLLLTANVAENGVLFFSSNNGGNFKIQQ